MRSAHVPVDVLNEEKLLEAVRILADRDPVLASIVQRYGAPPLWFRPPGFATLILIILEQQVSLSSARAAYIRLEKSLGELNPTSFVKLNDAELKIIGFSRQKTSYGRKLANGILDGSVDLEALEGLPDEEARAQLMVIKGIGRWSADIYLLMALRRPDIWPHSDLALIKTVSKIKGLERTLSSHEWETIGDAWRPWRSVAARLAWLDYLGGKT
ncbi:MAG: DNA-3-methyladenine glycosylase 2 family protein [Candidatus Bathyarchaeota archaeon]|nr:DNA-3-methyladenine glycosylase 2 family protein [Candidatus Bathyarchaeota archaeon]